MGANEVAHVVGGKLLLRTGHEDAPSEMQRRPLLLRAKHKKESGKFYLRNYGGMTYYATSYCQKLVTQVSGGAFD